MYNIRHNNIQKSLQVGRQVRGIRSLPPLFLSPILHPVPPCSFLPPSHSLPRYCQPPNLPRPCPQPPPPHGGWVGNWLVTGRGKRGKGKEWWRKGWGRIIQTDIYIKNRRIGMVQMHMGDMGNGSCKLHYHFNNVYKCKEPYMG